MGRTNVTRFLRATGEQQREREGRFADWWDSTDPRAKMRGMESGIAEESSGAWRSERAGRTMDERRLTWWKEGEARGKRERKRERERERLGSCRASAAGLARTFSFTSCSCLGDPSSQLPYRRVAVRGQATKPTRPDRQIKQPLADE